MELQCYLARLSPYLSARSVLVAGHGSNADHLAALLAAGAASITALDREPPRIEAPGAVCFVTSSFEDFVVSSDATWDVCFVAWPETDSRAADRALVELLQRCGVVIYLGSNVGGLACGGRRFWSHLGLERDVVAYWEFGQALHIYGSLHDAKPRPLVADEIAAIQRIENPELPPLSREAAEAAAAIMAADFGEIPEPTRSGLEGALEQISTAAGTSFSAAALDAFDRQDRATFLLLIQTESKRLADYRSDFFRLQDAKRATLDLFQCITGDGSVESSFRRLATAVGLDELVAAIDEERKSRGSNAAS